MKGARRTKKQRETGFADLMAPQHPTSILRGVVTGVSRAPATPPYPSPRSPPANKDDDWGSLLQTTPKRRISPQKPIVASRSTSRSNTMSPSSPPLRKPVQNSPKISPTTLSKPAPHTTSTDPPAKPATTSTAMASASAVPAFLSGWDGAEGWGDDPTLEDSDPDVDEDAWGGWPDTEDIGIPSKSTPVVTAPSPAEEQPTQPPAEDTRSDVLIPPSQLERSLQLDESESVPANWGSAAAPIAESDGKTLRRIADTTAAQPEAIVASAFAPRAAPIVPKISGAQTEPPSDLSAGQIWNAPQEERVHPLSDDSHPESPADALEKQLDEEPGAVQAVDSVQRETAPGDGSAQAAERPNLEGYEVVGASGLNTNIANEPDAFAAWDDVAIPDEDPTDFQVTATLQPETENEKPESEARPDHASHGTEEDSLICNFANSSVSPTDEAPQGLEGTAHDELGKVVEGKLLSSAAEGPHPEAAPQLAGEPEEVQQHETGTARWGFEESKDMEADGTAWAWEAKSTSVGPAEALAVKTDYTQYASGTVGEASGREDPVKVSSALRELQPSQPVAARHNEPPKESLVPTQTPEGVSQEISSWAQEPSSTPAEGWSFQESSDPDAEDGWGWGNSPGVQGGDFSTNATENEQRNTETGSDLHAPLAYGHHCDAGSIHRDEVGIHSESLPVIARESVPDERTGVPFEVVSSEQHSKEAGAQHPQMPAERGSLSEVPDVNEKVFPDPKVTVESKLFDPREASLDQRKSGNGDAKDVTADIVRGNGAYLEDDMWGTDVRSTDVDVSSTIAGTDVPSVAAPSSADDTEWDTDRSHSAWDAAAHPRIEPCQVNQPSTKTDSRSHADHIFTREKRSDAAWTNPDAIWSENGTPDSDGGSAVVTKSEGKEGENAQAVTSMESTLAAREMQDNHEPGPEARKAQGHGDDAVHSRDDQRYDPVSAAPQDEASSSKAERVLYREVRKRKEDAGAERANVGPAPLSWNGAHVSPRIVSANAQYRNVSVPQPSDALQSEEQRITAIAKSDPMLRGGTLPPQQSRKATDSFGGTNEYDWNANLQREASKSEPMERHRFETSVSPSRNGDSNNYWTQKLEAASHNEAEPDRFSQPAREDSAWSDQVQVQPTRKTREGKGSREPTGKETAFSGPESAFHKEFGKTEGTTAGAHQWPQQMNEGPRVGAQVESESDNLQSPPLPSQSVQPIETESAEQSRNAFATSPVPGDFSQYAPQVNEVPEPPRSTLEADHANVQDAVADSQTFSESASYDPFAPSEADIGKQSHLTTDAFDWNFGASQQERGGKSYTQSYGIPQVEPHPSHVEGAEVASVSYVQKEGSSIRERSGETSATVPSNANEGVAIAQGSPEASTASTAVIHDDADEPDQVVEAIYPSNVEVGFETSLEEEVHMYAPREVGQREELPVQRRLGLTEASEAIQGFPDTPADQRAPPGDSVHRYAPQGLLQPPLSKDSALSDARYQSTMQQTPALEGDAAQQYEPQRAVQAEETGIRQQEQSLGHPEENVSERGETPVVPNLYSPSHENSSRLALSGLLPPEVQSGYTHAELQSTSPMLEEPVTSQDVKWEGHSSHIAGRALAHDLPNSYGSSHPEVPTAWGHSAAPPFQRAPEAETFSHHHMINNQAAPLGGSDSHGRSHSNLSADTGQAREVSMENTPFSLPTYRPETAYQSSADPSGYLSQQGPQSTYGAPDAEGISKSGAVNGFTDKAATLEVPPPNVYEALSADGPYHYNNQHLGDPNGLTMMDATAFSYPFSIMDTGTSGDLGYRQPRPVITWGFGGTLVTVIPLTASTPQDNPDLATSEKPCTTKVQIFDMSAIGRDVADDDWAAASEAVQPLSYPLRPPDLLMYADMCERLAKSSAGLTGSAAEGRAALWRTLALLCRQGTSDWRTAACGAVCGPSSVPLFGRRDHSAFMSGRSQIESPLKPDYAASRRSEIERSEAASEVERLITQGNGAEAIRVAQDAGLWSVALVLAATLDRNLYMNAITEFAKSNLSDGSALQTLCFSVAENDSEIMRKATSPSGLKDWRKTVGILLTSRRSTVNTSDRDGRRFLKLIEQLGDSLIAQKGDVVAGHVCYLLSGRLGPLDKSSVPLLGADGKVPPGRPRSLGSPAAVLQSVVYEAIFNVQSGESFPHILPFRLLLSQEIAALGRPDVALAHCESMSSAVRAVFNSGGSNSAARHFTAPFLSSLESFEQRLRSHLGLQESQQKQGTLSALGQSLSSVFGKSSVSVKQNPALSEKRVPTSVPTQTTHQSAPFSQPMASGAPLWQQPVNDSSTPQMKPTWGEAPERPQLARIPPANATAMGEPPEKDEKSGNERWNSIVSRTIGFIAPADGDLSPPPRPRNDSGFSQPQPAPLGLGPGTGSRAPGHDTHLGHMRSASVGDVPGTMIPSQAAPFGANPVLHYQNEVHPTAPPSQPPRSSIGDHEPFNGMSVKKTTKEERGTEVHHRRSASDMTFESQTSEKKPPRQPKKSPSSANSGDPAKSTRPPAAKGWRGRWSERIERIRASLGGPPRAHMGVENKFVYDKKRNRWIIEGEDPSDEADVPPPPPDDDSLFGSGSNVQASQSYDALPHPEMSAQSLPRSFSAQYDQLAENFYGTGAGGEAHQNPKTHGFPAPVSNNSSMDTVNARDNESESSVASAASAPVPFSSESSFPPTATVGNKFRAGSSRLSGRRAYVDTFNKGAPAPAMSGLRTPTRPPMPGLGGMGGTPGGNGYRIFTPSTAPSSESGNNFDGGGGGAGSATSSVVDTSEFATSNVGGGQPQSQALPSHVSSIGPPQGTNQRSSPTVTSYQAHARQDRHPRLMA